MLLLRELRRFPPGRSWDDVVDNSLEQGRALPSADVRECHPGTRPPGGLGRLSLRGAQTGAGPVPGATREWRRRRRARAQPARPRRGLRLPLNYAHTAQETSRLIGVAGLARNQGSARARIRPDRERPSATPWRACGVPCCFDRADRRRWQPAALAPRRIWPRQKRPFSSATTSTDTTGARDEFRCIAPSGSIMGASGRSRVWTRISARSRGAARVFAGGPCDRYTQADRGLRSGWAPDASLVYDPGSYGSGKCSFAHLLCALFRPRAEASHLAGSKLLRQVDPQLAATFTRERRRLDALGPRPPFRQIVTAEQEPIAP